MKINRLLIPLLLGLWVMVSPGCHRGEKEANATIRLKIRGSLGEMAYLQKVTLEEPVMVDSALIDDQGEGIFRINTDDFDYFLLKLGASRPIMLAVEKDENVEIFTSADRFGEEYEVRGSGASSLLQELEIRKALTRNRLDSLGNIWHKVEYAPDKLEQKMVLDSLAEKFQAEHKEWLAGFIAKYPESPASVLAIYQLMGPAGAVFSLKQDSSLFFSLGKTLSEKYPGNLHVKDFNRRNEEFKKETAEWHEREKLLATGMESPTFDLISTSGERVNLASLRGNVVLMYFWDARNKECWDINLQLSELYRQHSAKGFRICGIYTGTDNQLLYNAIQIDKLPWIHLLGTSEVVKTYNADPIPSLLLIGRDGKVAYRSLTVQQLAARLPLLMAQTSAGTQTLPDNGPN